MSGSFKINISGAMSETDKFMDKFDPVNSEREKRKKMRHQQANSSPASGSAQQKRPSDL